MIDNWMVPRNKRKLYQVIDILSLFTLQNLGDVWDQDVTRQLNFEAELERYGIKRTGNRRDQRAGGARTYEAWLDALGLIYKENGTRIIRTTLAGDALLAGQPPVPIMTNQLMKLQFPSPYSLRGRVNIDSRFRIRPFRFMLRLLADPRIAHLTKQEIARYLVTYADSESNAAFENIVRGILDFRARGDAALPTDFATRYPNISYLEDIANTFINFLEYTQLIARDTPSSPIYIPQSRAAEVAAILQNDRGFIRQPENEEVFQRSFGLPPGATRDNRNFAGQTVTEGIYRTRRVRGELLHIASERLFTDITASIIDEIATATGFTVRQVEEALQGFRPDTYSVFEASYLNMAISGTDLDTEFEVATTSIFNQLGFRASHIGNHGLNPDILVESPQAFHGIIDTKAYRAYSITNDHRNRMLNNYIPTHRRGGSLSFYMYVADGFIRGIDAQIQSLAAAAPGVNGCAITAADLIRLLHRHLARPVNHANLQRLFTLNRRITIHDIDSLP